MLLTLFFTMSGIGNVIGNDVELDNAALLDSQLTETVYSTDTEHDENLSATEGNIFSSSSFTHKIRNSRVNIRRKCGGGGYNFITAEQINLNHPLFFEGYLFCKCFNLHLDIKEYFISLRKFII